MRTLLDNVRNMPRLHIHI